MEITFILISPDIVLKVKVKVEQGPELAGGSYYFNAPLNLNLNLFSGGFYYSNAPLNLILNLNLVI